MWHVIGTKGCGSVLVEAALTLANLPYEHEEIDYAKPSADRDRLLAKNPLGQVPTVTAPDGTVMTETAAIIWHLDELVPDAKLLPPVGTPERRDAQRWLIFIIAAVYPTWTYGDEPEKWVGDAGPRLRESTNAHRQKLWLQVESEIAQRPGPWFLGATRSILDVYVSVMTRWRPNRPWFATNTPRLSAIAAAIDEDPRLAPLWAANFD